MGIVTAFNVEKIMSLLLFQQFHYKSCNRWVCVKFVLIFVSDDVMCNYLGTNYLHLRPNKAITTSKMTTLVLEIVTSVIYL